MTGRIPKRGFAARPGDPDSWIKAGDGPPLRGLGQRVFLVGDEGRSVMELTTLAFGGAS